MRLNLLDASDCLSNCSEMINNEHYYSFHQLLDKAQETTVVTTLRGDDQTTSPFVRTGWVGTLGNNVLDKEFIKGLTLEISMNNKGSIGSVASGHVIMGDFVAGMASRLTANEAISEEIDATFSVASLLKENSHFTHIPFATAQVRPPESHS